MTSPNDRAPVLIGYDGHDDAAAAIRGAGLVHRTPVPLLVVPDRR